MSFIKYFCTLFNAMFTIIMITFTLFKVGLQSDPSLVQSCFQSMGLAAIFASVIAGVDYLSNKMVGINNKWLLGGQYVVLLGIIVCWAAHFAWGDWSNKSYVLIFVISFSIIYVLVCLLLDTRYKKQDKDLTKLLHSYQKKIKL
ncbi:MAG: hypothetical protein RR448_07945 [Niameybacter sp.]